MNIFFASARPWHGIIALARTCVLLFGLCTATSHAQQLPTRGVRFWAGFPQNVAGAQSLQVHIMGDAATSGMISIPNTGWSTPFSVGAIDVTVVTVPNMAEHMGSGAVLDKAVLITAQDTVNVFIRTRQSFSQDMAQVLPENALGTLYRVDAQRGITAGGNTYRSQFLVVATVDGTQIRITPTVNTLNGNPAQVPFLVDLDAGQTYQLQAATGQDDLTGTLVEGTEASGPCRVFALFGGSSCAEFPAGCGTCDVMLDQLSPVTAWSTNYQTVPVALVANTSYRVLAHEDGTAVNINGTPTVTLQAGETHTVFGQTAGACITTSKPASAVQFLEAYACGQTGDPSMMQLSPSQQMSHDVSFRAQNSDVVNKHVFSLVVPITAIGEVALNGAPMSTALFQPYGACPQMAHATLEVVQGVHRVTSEHGFQLHAIGLGQGESVSTMVQNIAGTSIVQDSVVCAGGTITLEVPELLNDIAWTAASDPNTVIGTGSSITVTPTASESYTVTGTASLTGCPLTFTYHVGVPLTIPTWLTANGETTADICQYEDVSLALVPVPDPNWFTVSWTPAWPLSDPTSATPTAAPLEDTWFVVNITSPSGCGDMTDSLFVGVANSNILDMHLSADPASVCAGGTVQLGAEVLKVIANDRFNNITPGAMWASVQGGVLNDLCGSQTGNALYFNGNGQRSATTIGLNTSGGGRLQFALKIANGMAPCSDAGPGEDVILEYSVNFGANWLPITTYAEDGHPDLTPITADIPSGAQGPNTMFRWRQLANNGAGHDNWVLDDVLIARYDNGTFDYAWAGGPLNDAAIMDPTTQPMDTNWYSLQVTDPATSCTRVDSVLIEVAPAFTLSLSADTTICDVAGILLEVVPSFDDGTTYNWTPNDGTIDDPHAQTPLVTPSASTSYTVQAVNAIGCSAQASVTVTVGQLIGLDLSATSDTICQGQSTQLSALAQGGPGLTYQWTGDGLNNTGIANPVATPTTTTTYTCTISEPGSACTLSESVIIVVNTGYMADAGPDLSICSVVGHQLHVAHNVPGATYQWLPEAGLNTGNIQSPTILSGGSGTWTVTITDANGCSVTDEVTLNEAFEGVPTSQTVSACANEPPLLTAPVSGVDHVWSTGATSAAIIAPYSGPISVTMTDEQGCEGHTTFHVTLHPLPVVDLGADTALCGATDFVLHAGNPGAQFLWSTSAQTPQITVEQTGTYSVSVTDANGCTASDAVHVAFHELPPDLLNDVTACVMDPPVLTAGPAAHSYLWSTNATTPSIVADASGTYEVLVTTAEGCSATYDAVVTLAPEVFVELGNDTSFCEGGALLLNALNPDATYLWSTGQTTPEISVSTSGSYAVLVSNAACQATDTIHLDVLPGPLNNLSDITICSTETAVLDAGNPGASYLWGNGSTTQTLVVTASGPQQVTVTMPNGCSGTFNAQITLVSPPVVELGTDTVLCEGDVLWLDAGPDGTSYTWSNGAASPTIAVQQGGTYSVQVGNGYCVVADSITTVFNPSPVRMALRQVFTCLDEDPRHVRLDAGNPGSQFVWSSGENSQVVLASAYGWYYVDVKNIFDCTARDSVQVSEYCPSAIYVPNTFTPNGDGLNDVFIPVGKNIASMELLIFDRWGAVIFESNDPAMGWDGQYRSAPVKEDIYMWRLRYRFAEDPEGTLGMEQERMGHIQVMR